MSQQPSCSGWNSAECAGTPECPPRCPRFVDKEGVRWTVRPATVDDREPLAAMYGRFEASDRAQGIPPVDERRRREWLDQLLTEGVGVVAENSQAGVVGHAVYTPADASLPELAVFVAPAFHGRGLGTELCWHVIAAAADAGCEALVLHVERDNRAAVHVYRRLGFETVRGGRELEMRLSLSAPPADEARLAPAERVATV